MKRQTFKKKTGIKSIKIIFLFCQRQRGCLEGIFLGDEAALRGRHGEDPGELEEGQLARTRRRAEDLQVLTRLKPISQLMVHHTADAIN